MRLRKQDINRIKKECKRYDLDHQEYDFEAQSYAEIMNDIHKRAGVKTPQMVEEEEAQWESVAEYVDSRTIEEKVHVPEGTRPASPFVNCLVLKFRPHDFSLAKTVLTAMFKGNIMDRTWKILQMKTQLHSTERYLWLMGHRHTTDMMLAELRKRNIRPRILRNYNLRNDFTQYHNSQLIPMRRSEYRKMMQPASTENEQRLQKLMTKIFH